MAVRPSDEELFSVFSELNAVVELVFFLVARLLFVVAASDVLLTTVDVGAGEVTVVVLPVDVVPKLEVTLSNGEGD